MRLPSMRCLPFVLMRFCSCACPRSTSALPLAWAVSKAAASHATTIDGSRAADSGADKLLSYSAIAAAASYHPFAKCSESVGAYTAAAVSAVGA